MKLSPSPGWLSLYCVNHPHKRWAAKLLTKHHISRNTQLMYSGEYQIGGQFIEEDRYGILRQRPEIDIKPGNEVDGNLNPEWECDCPMADLRDIQTNLPYGAACHFHDEMGELDR